MASETVDPLSSTYCTLQCGLQITRLAAMSEPRTCDLRNTRQQHCLCGHSGYVIIVIIDHSYHIVIIDELVVHGELSPIQLVKQINISLSVTVNAKNLQPRHPYNALPSGIHIKSASCANLACNI